MNTMIVPCIAPNTLYNSALITPPGATLLPSSASSIGPTNGIACPSYAIDQRIVAIRQNPKNRNASPQNPYCMPMTLWSVEKTYVRQKLCA